ncbi:MAG: CPBP family intramembrane metalloprotease [Nocardioides sp.]|nr:CPBP family intramembrane metalloprotease [Nocardioides sp.]
MSWWKQLLLQLVLVVVVSLVGSELVAAMGWNPGLTLVAGLVVAWLALTAYRWVVRRTERREVSELARADARRGLGRGTLLGLAMFVVVIVLIAIFASYRVDGFGSASGPVALLGFMAAGAVTEELMFRGVLLRFIERGAGTWVALATTSLAFGLMHIMNPNATVWSALAIAIEAGGMLGAAYVATRSLWVPIGMHFAWNFAGSAIFGTTISGKDAPAGLLESTTTGPHALGGGAFGPEGSVFTVLVGAGIMVAFLTYAARHGRIVPLRRAKRSLPVVAADTVAP